MLATESTAQIGLPSLYKCNPKRIGLLSIFTVDFDLFGTKKLFEGQLNWKELTIQQFGCGYVGV